MNKLIGFALVLIFLLVGGVRPGSGSECAVPPFISATPIPNVMIAFDNSASMYDLAFHSDEFCYDATYSSAATYYGYYDRDIYYVYDSFLNRFKVTDSMPSGSACSNPTGQTEFCIQKNIKTFYFRGNFLNWLSMSKFDLIKQALSGGKYDNNASSLDYQTLKGESRGCVGRRMVKELPGSTVVFAIRGSVPFGHGYDTLYVGGTTQIEVYDSSQGFNMQACLDAIDALEAGQLGQAQTSTDECLGLSQKSNELAAFNHSMQSCWSLGQGSALGQGDVSRMANACDKVIDALPKVDGKPQWTDASGNPVLDTNNAAYVCTSLGNGDNPTDPHYIGDCWAICDPLNWKNDASCEQCVLTGLQNYCGVLDTPEVIDPTDDLGATGSFGNIPAILIDSGVVGQLGGSGPISTLRNVKAQGSAPEGLLQSFKDRMKLGLMAMNPYGSNYELSATEKQDYYYQSADVDGGAVKSEVQRGNEEIAGRLNDLVAFSWTPIGEIFYEAARYFGARGSAYNSGVTYETPIENECQKSFVLLLSDGASTYDQNIPGTHFSGQTAAVTDTDFNVAEYLSSAEHQTQLAYKGTYYGKGVAYWAHTHDLNSTIGGTQNLDFYSVLALGSAQGAGLLQDIAKYGGFADLNHNGQPDSLEDGKSEWDRDGNGTIDSYFQVNQPSELEGTLEAALRKIGAALGSAGAVATVTQQILGEDIVIRGAFTSYEGQDREKYAWKGHLESYWPYAGCSTLISESACAATAGCGWDGGHCSGELYSFQLPSNSGRFCADPEFTGGHCWDAGTKLTSAAYAGRCVFTALDGVMTAFDDASESCTLSFYDSLAVDLDGIKAALANDIDFNQDGDTGNDGTALLNWIRGQWQDSWSDIARDRNGWILGDIVYSTPVVVGAPSLASVAIEVTGACDCDCLSAVDSVAEACADQCFYCFQRLHQNREKVVYVAANDGMLHAFLVEKYNSLTGTWVFDSAADAEIGRELWAYIPSNLLSELKELARATYGVMDCDHRFLLDLSPVVRDVFIRVDSDGDGSLGDETPKWRTVLVGGERSGGDTYFALDVTDPRHPKLLWEYPVVRNLVSRNDSGVNQFLFADLAQYNLVKDLPYSWSSPDIARFKIPSDYCFVANSPINPLDATPTIAPASRCAGSLAPWVAVIGSGGRVFDLPAELSAAQTATLQQPHLLILDLETGVDYMQYLWPKIYADHQGTWPTLTSGGNTIAYALSGALALDLTDLNGRLHQDGYLDHIIFGDLNGLFYSLVIDNQQAGAVFDIWTAKNGLNASNVFRSRRQPMTVTPTAAFDPAFNLRLFFGSGKFDEVRGAADDKTDDEPMSFYSVSTAVTLPGSGTESSDGVGIQWNSGHCPDSTVWLDDSGWLREVVSDDQCSIEADCGEATCPSTCWSCVLDLFRNGERVINDALVAGDIVFFTTFVPSSDPCEAGGDSYFYALDYLCRPLNVDVFAGSGFTLVDLSPDQLSEGQYAALQKTTADGQVAIGYAAKLGEGLPSRPVLDSSIEHVLIQTSNAKIHRIKVKTINDPLYLKGWKEDGY